MSKASDKQVEQEEADAEVAFRASQHGPSFGLDALKAEINNLATTIGQPLTTEAVTRLQDGVNAL